MLDMLVVIVAIFGVAMTVPQITEIWFNKSAAGVSIYTWGSYAVGSLFWFLYGAYHKEKVIMIPNVLGLFLNLLVVGGILVYGLK